MNIGTFDQVPTQTKVESILQGTGTLKLACILSSVLNQGIRSAHCKMWLPYL